MEDVYSYVHDQNNCYFKVCVCFCVFFFSEMGVREKLWRESGLMVLVLFPSFKKYSLGGFSPPFSIFHTL